MERPSEVAHAAALREQAANAPLPAVGVVGVACHFPVAKVFARLRQEHQTDVA